MRKSSLMLTLACSVFFPEIGYADQIPNGCGPKGYGWLVPDSTPLTMCSFERSCDKHDICYSRCTEGGDLFGLPTCDNENEKAARRKKCDEDFFTNISYFNSDRPICRLYGKAYAFFVSKGGSGFFQGYERPEMFFNDISNRPAEIDSLINQLDKQILDLSPTFEAEAFIIFKSEDSYNLGDITDNDALRDQLSRGLKDFAPAIQMEQAQ